MKTVKQMWVFDVDGVITDLFKKKITHPQILRFIASRLEKGEPVALNTGRSIKWIKDRVINPLLERVKYKKILQNFFAVGEKGGAWLTFDPNGVMQHYKDDSITVPSSLQKKVRNLVKSDFSDSIFFDESKETMISAEMKDEFPLEEFKEAHEELNRKLQKLIDEDSLNKNLKLDPTTIATDIENKHVGKHFGIKRIVEWTKNKGIKPQRYIAFGDSFRSDIPMAEEINSQGLPVEFVYVGKEQVSTTAFPFPIHKTNEKFEKGTLEFIKNLEV